MGIKMEKWGEVDRIQVNKETHTPYFGVFKLHLKISGKPRRTLSLKVTWSDLQYRIPGNSMAGNTGTRPEA